MSESKIKYVNTWATEVEIHAAADLFGVDIYTYIQETWPKFAANTQQRLDKGVYLQHCNQCHYQPIECVKDSASQKCV